jgi:hypothetical protein
MLCETVKEASAWLAAAPICLQLADSLRKHDVELVRAELGTGFLF